MRWSRFTPAAIALPLALVCLCAHAAGDDDHQGLLLQAEAGGHRMMVCIQQREGRFYTVTAPDAQDAFFTLHTRYMARPEGASAPDALAGVWQIGQDSFELPKPQSDDDADVDKIELKASGPNRWSGTLHHQSTFAPKPTWADTPITLTQIAGDCGAFEDQRLKLPWEPDEPGNGYQAAAVKFRTLKHPATQITRVELLPNGVLAAAPAERINAQLAQLAADMSDDWSGCQDYDDAYIALIADSPRLAVFEQTSSSYCGGAHPNEEANLYIFDLQTGERVELNTWFVGDGQALPSGLWKLVARGIDREMADQPECVDRMKETRSFVPWFAAGGMQFRYVESARPYIECRGDFVTLPYKAVRPFIKPERRNDFDADVKSLGAPR